MQTKEERAAYMRAHNLAHQEKIRVQKAIYGATHKEEIRIRRQAYYRSHAAEIKAWQKKHREEHREEVSARKKAYHKANRETIRARQRAHYWTHREELKAKARAYRTANKEKILSLRKFREHGLSATELDALFNGQNKKCAICGTTQFNGWGPTIDHDHTTGRIRGILCSTCNTMLGHAKDSIFILKSAIQYLRRANTWPEEDVPEILITPMKDGGTTQ